MPARHRHTPFLHESAMTESSIASCPLVDAALGVPECSKRLVLRECLERWGVEAQHAVVDTGRYRCRYVVWGRGPTLVLIPGMATDALGFAMLMARLQSHFRCVSFDLPSGDGDGARMLKYTHADHVADLFALLDHLHIQQCFVLGSSFGSTIALAAMHRQPRRFSHAILQGGFARRPLARAEVLGASFCRFLPGRLRHTPFVVRILEHNARAEFPADDRELWEFFVEQHLQIPLRAFAARALLVHRIDLRSILPTIEQPVLLLVGDRDRLVGKACEVELRQGLPLAARAEIEQCGHMPQMTHPEVAAEVVRQFLMPSCSI
jgi:pimeloyl-ACP methyl ester carboxylesterase